MQSKPSQRLNQDNKLEHLRNAENKSISHVTREMTKSMRLNFRNFVCQKSEASTKRGNKNAEVEEFLGEATFKSFSVSFILVSILTYIWQSQDAR